MNTAQWVVSEILRYGKVRRGYLGIAGSVKKLDKKLVRFYELANETAVLIEVVEKNSPSDRAGLKEFDLIVSMNGKIVGNVDDLHRLLSERVVGEPLELTIIRGYEKLKITVVPTEAV